jgi:alkanesulfonate monooxygenase SsuD/methylene tetrahydromethanopterin reductase-like flavin-dependent oxidoreductase (luciferase family)
LTDLISGGRLEFGIGSGAYQREFDRMYPGLKQSDAWRYMQEMLPAVRALWKGDYAHDGEFWQFPTSHLCPEAASEAEVRPSGSRHGPPSPTTSPCASAATSCAGR